MEPYQRESNNQFWTCENDQRLYALVQNTPELQDPKLAKHVTKESIWRKIATNFNLPPYECERRWNQLTEKGLKKSIELKKGYPEAQCSKRKDFDGFVPNIMKRNRPAAKAVETIVTINTSDHEEMPNYPPLNENINDEVIEVEKETSMEPFLEPSKTTETTAASVVNKILMPPPPTPQTIEYSTQQSLDLFFLLMSNAVKNFSAVDQHLVKAQVFRLVHEVEAKYIYQAQFKRPPEAQPPAPAPAQPYSPKTFSVLIPPQHRLKGKNNSPLPIHLQEFPQPHQ